MLCKIILLESSEECHYPGGLCRLRPSSILIQEQELVRPCFETSSWLNVIKYIFGHTTKISTFYKIRRCAESRKTADGSSQFKMWNRTICYIIFSIMSTRSLTRMHAHTYTHARFLKQDTREMVIFEVYEDAWICFTIGLWRPIEKRKWKCQRYMSSHVFSVLFSRSRTCDRSPVPHGAVAESTFCGGDSRASHLVFTTYREQHVPPRCVPDQ